VGLAPARRRGPRRARPRTVRTPGVVGGGPARLEPPAAVARRNLGACGRPRGAGRNGLRNGARRAARGHAHPTGGGCTIAVHIPSRGAQPAPRGTHGVIPAHQQLAPGVPSPLMPSCPAPHPTASSRAGRPPSRRTSRARRPCTRPGSSTTLVIFWRVQRPFGSTAPRKRIQATPADIWARHTFARRCHRRVRGACARWPRHSSRSGPPQGPALRPRSMVDWRQNFQRAGFRIA
jgi:hypothetical protein